MFKNIKIENMKLFEKFEISDLKRFNLIVGKNNCGKTSLIESIFLLIAPTNTMLPMSINKFRGIDNIDEGYWTHFFHKFKFDKPIVISGVVKLPKYREKRTLKITPNISYQTDEMVSQKSINQKTGFSNIPAIVTGLQYQYKQKVGNKKVKTYDNLQVILNGRGPTGTFLKNYKESLSGSYFSNSTMYWDMPKRFHDVIIRKKTDDILKVMQKIDSSIVNIEMGADDSIMCDIGLSKLVSIQSMGAGFVKAFSLLLAIQASSNGIILIDELENGLHHSAMKIIWDAIIESAYAFNVQIFTTTHSLECVHAFNNAIQSELQLADDYRLYRLDRDGYTITAKDFNPNDLNIALESNWEIR